MPGDKEAFVAGDVSIRQAETITRTAMAVPDAEAELLELGADLQFEAVERHGPESRSGP